MPCLFVEWVTITHLAKETALKIKSSGFRPDTIVAIARGGVVPGRLFCDHLHLKHFAVIKVDHWGVTAAKDGRARLSYGMSVNLKGKRALLVDDITDTGQSMEIARKYLFGLKPREIKTATLYHLKGSAYVPDFFGEEREWAWMVFPWNRQEDLINLVEKLLGRSKKYPDVGKLKRKMKHCFKLEVEVAELEETLDNLVYLGKRNWKD